MGLLNLATFGDETGRGTASLEYNDSNGRAQRLVIDNGTTRTYWAWVKRLSDGNVQQATFAPNAAGAPSNVTIPAGWVVVTIQANGELVTNTPLEVQDRFPA